MSGNIVLGYWDCPLCQSKAISGLARDCPNCGKPRGDEVKFYMIDKKNYLDADTAASVGNKPDWLCEFCKSLNNNKLTTCPSCGANKGTSKRNYFGDVL